MIWIKYQVLQCTVGETSILVNKKLGYSEENLLIAEKEAYNGYEIIEDGEALNKEPVTLEDKNHPGCFYRVIDGEKEWVNPPAIVGFEYRTSERYNGRPVYMKIYRIGEVEPGDKSQFPIEYTPSVGYLVSPIRSHAFAYMMRMGENTVEQGRVLDSGNSIGFTYGVTDNVLSYNMPSTVDRPYFIDVQVWYIKA